MLVAFAKKARDVFAEDAYFEKREMSADIDERSLWCVPNGGRKAQTDLLRTGECNSTVPEGCGTGISQRNKSGKSLTEEKNYWQ
jgi:hypothetical protein